MACFVLQPALATLYNLSNQATHEAVHLLCRMLVFDPVSLRFRTFKKSFLHAEVYKCTTHMGLAELHVACKGVTVKNLLWLNCWVMTFLCVLNVSFTIYNLSEEVKNILFYLHCRKREYLVRMLCHTLTLMKED